MMKIGLHIQQASCECCANLELSVAEQVFIVQWLRLSNVGMPK